MIIIIGIICLVIGCIIGLSIIPYGSCLSYEEVIKIENGYPVFYKLRGEDMKERLGEVACRDLKKVIIDSENGAIVDIFGCDVWAAVEEECE